MHSRSQERDLSAYTVPYRLREEARESWDYAVSDKFVYSFDSGEVGLDFPKEIAKLYLEGHAWVECHLTFHAERDIHYQVLAEKEFGLRDGHRSCNHASHPVNGNSHVLVDIAKFVQPPQKKALNIRTVRSVVRLKRFDDGHCLCGYTPSLPLESLDIALLKNRELSAFGIGGGGSSRGFCQTPNKLVEGGSEIVKNVSSNEGEPVRDCRMYHPDDMPLIFNVILTSESIGFRFAENLEFLPETFQMFLRPSGLEIGVNQWHAKS
jgi:hypothetical protein